MASAYTSGLGLELPARNDYKNTWDTPVNANFSAIDAVIAGTSTVNIGNGTTGLSKAQSQASIIIVGALSTASTVLLPAGRAGTFTVVNGTSGGQPVSFGAAPGNGALVTLTSGIRTLVFSDGVNVFLADQSSVPPGTVLSYMGATIPGGFLPAVGQNVSRTAYAALFAVFGTTYGAGDGSTTFTMPDLRGCVLAALDSGRGVLNTFGNSGNQLGALGGEQAHSLTPDQNAQHTHAVGDQGHSHDNTDNGHAHTEGINTTNGSYQVPNSGGSQALAYLQGGSNIVTSTAKSGITVKSATSNITIGSSGGGNAHNNVQPTTLVNFIVKT